MGALELLELALPWLAFSAYIFFGALHPPVTYELPAPATHSRCAYLEEWAIAQGRHVVGCTDGVLGR